MMVAIVGVMDALVVGAVVGATDEVVGAELVVGMLDEDVEEVVGIEEEVVGISELLEKIIEEDVVDDSVLGTGVGLVLAIELLDG